MDASFPAEFDPSSSRFRTTQWTLVDAAKGEDATAIAAREWFSREYRKPVLQHIRALVTCAQDAEDITQDFFVEFIHNGALSRAAAEKGSLRSYIKAIAKRRVADWQRKQSAQKRGGNVTHTSMDDPETNLNLTSLTTSSSAEADSDLPWALTIMERVLQALDHAMRHAAIYPKIRPLLDGEVLPQTYVEIGREVGLAEGSVSAAVKHMRDKFKAYLHLEVSHLTTNEADLQAELAYLRALVLRNRP